MDAHVRLCNDHLQKFETYQARGRNKSPKPVKFNGEIVDARLLFLRLHHIYLQEKRELMNADSFIGYFNNSSSIGMLQSILATKTIVIKSRTTDKSPVKMDLKRERKAALDALKHTKSSALSYQDYNITLGDSVYNKLVVGAVNVMSLDGRDFEGNNIPVSAVSKWKIRCDQYKVDLFMDFECLDSIIQLYELYGINYYVPLGKATKTAPFKCSSANKKRKLDDVKEGNDEYEM